MFTLHPEPSSRPKGKFGKIGNKAFGDSYSTCDCCDPWLNRVIGSNAALCVYATCAQIGSAPIYLQAAWLGVPILCVLRDPTLAILAMSFSDSEEYDESLEHDLVYVSQLQTIGEKIYDSLTDDDKVARLIM